jgi:MFS transporter, MCT family, solute carrier family 16 (monocarboxylic acid transporters), member 10
MFDALGPRIMVSFSGLVVVFSLMMLSLTKPNQIWQQFLTQTILFSIGATAGFFSALGLMTHWFRRNASLAMGIVAGSASIGGIIHPIVLRRLIPTLGFGWAVRIDAFICLFTFACALVLIKPRRPRGPIPSIKKLLAFEALKNPVFVVLAIGAWFICFGLLSPFFYVGLYALATSGDSPLIPYYLTILATGSVIGRMLPGMLADRIGRFNVVTIAMYLASIFTLALWYTSHDQPSLIAFAVLYGFFSGPFFSLIPACVASLAPVDRIGAYTGMFFSVLSTGAFAGSPINGAMIQNPTVENFRHMILFSVRLLFTYSYI